MISNSQMSTQTQHTRMPTQLRNTHVVRCFNAPKSSMTVRLSSAWYERQLFVKIEIGAIYNSATTAITPGLPFLPAELFVEVVWVPWKFQKNKTKLKQESEGFSTEKVLIREVQQKNNRQICTAIYKAGIKQGFLYAAIYSNSVRNIPVHCGIYDTNDRRSHTGVETKFVDPARTEVRIFADGVKIN